MDVDDDTIIEIRENTAVTREKVEQLEAKFDDTDSQLRKHDERLDEHQSKLSKLEDVPDEVKGNSRYLMYIRGGIALTTLLVTIIAGMHGWVVPFI